LFEKEHILLFFEEKQPINGKGNTFPFVLFLPPFYICDEKEKVL
jgi:hypothetical protein